MNPEAVTETNKLQALLKEVEDSLVAGDPQQAASAAEKALALDPENYQALYGLGVALVALGQFQDALTPLKKLEPIAPDEGKQASVLLVEGVAFQELGLHAEALDAFARSQSHIAADDRATLLFRQAVSFNATQQPQAALQALEQVEAMASPDQDRGVVLLHKGIALTGVGKDELAFKVFDEARPLLNGLGLANCLLQQGRLLNNKGEFAKAEPLLTEAVRQSGNGTALSPIGVLANFHLAISLSGLTRPADSLAAVDKFLAAQRATEPPPAPAPMEAQALALKAGLLARLGKTSDIPAVMEEAEKADPSLKTNVLFWLRKTSAYLEAGTAIEALAPPPAEIADHPLVTSMRGGFFLTGGQWRQGRELLLRAAGLKDSCGDDPLRWLGVGFANFNLWHWKDATDAFSRACSLNPALRSDVMVLFALSSCYDALGKSQEAWELLKDLDTDSEMLLMARANALKAIGRNEESLETLNRLSRVASSSLPQVVLLRSILRGNLLLALNRPDDALQCFSDAGAITAGLSEDNPFRLLVAVGHAGALMTLNRYTEALAILNQVTRTDVEEGFPKRGIGWELTGAVLAQLGRREESLRALNRAHSLEPHSADILAAKGQVLLNLEDYKNAEEAFGESLKLATTTRERYEALIGRGHALNRLEFYERAIDCFRDALAAVSQPEDTDWRFWVGLGEAYRSLGRYEAAYHTLRQGWRLDQQPKKSKDLAVGIGAALLDQNHNQDALSFLTEAKDRAAHDPRIDFNLGVALYRLKQRAAAKKAWERAGAEGFQQAKEYLEQMESSGVQRGDWLAYWFGTGTSYWRKITGIVLSAATLAVAFLPILRKDAWHSLPRLNTAADYKAVIGCLVVLLLFLLAPALKTFSIGMGALKFTAAAPEATQKPDVDALLEKVQSISSNVTVGRHFSAQTSLAIVESEPAHK